MPALLAQRLDDKIERGAMRSVILPGRTKLYYPNGRLKQVFLSGSLKHSFDISHSLRTVADFEVVVSAFYVVMGGAYGGLLFQDVADFTGNLTNSGLTAIPGETNLYQMERLYTFGGQTYRRKITRPTGTITVYEGGGSVIGATVDPLTGIVNTAGVPARWVGMFNVPVAFKDDEWLSSYEVGKANLHMRMQPIMLEEVPE